MAVLHRALVVWFLIVIFLILTAIRLESKGNWSWFIVFIPMWVFDITVLIYSGFFMINRFKSIRNLRSSGHDHNFMPGSYCSPAIKDRLCNVAGIVLKMTFQILLCLKLDFPSWHLPLYYVLIPLWILLAAGLFRLGQILYVIATSDSLQDINAKLGNKSGTNPVSREGERPTAVVTGPTVTHRAHGRENEGGIRFGATALTSLGSHGLSSGSHR